MGEGLEAKVKKPGFFKRAALVAGTSLLALLAMGCNSHQYRARVQTKPPEEVKIYLDGKLAGKTSKTEPVYVETPLSFLAPPSFPCKISLKANKYEAFFIMNYQRDLLNNKSKDKIKILDPKTSYKNLSKNCLVARVTEWEKGPSYDFVFQIPKEFLKDLHTPEKRYTEWGDEIKEKAPVSKKLTPYTKPEKKEPLKKSNETNKLEEKIKKFPSSAISFKLFLKYSAISGNGIEGVLNTSEPGFDLTLTEKEVFSYDYGMGIEFNYSIINFLELGAKIGLNHFGSSGKTKYENNSVSHIDYTEFYVFDFAVSPKINIILNQHPRTWFTKENEDKLAFYIKPITLGFAHTNMEMYGFVSVDQPFPNPNLYAQCETSENILFLTHQISLGFEANISFSKESRSGLTFFLEFGYTTVIRNKNLESSGSGNGVSCSLTSNSSPLSLLDVITGVGIKF